jgi:hypothetical protein
MSIVASMEPRIRNIKINSDNIIAYLVDGRVVSVPLAWSWRLTEATVAQRGHFEIIGDGQGVHWPDVDEDISAKGILHGVPAHRPNVRLELSGANGEGEKKRQRLPSNIRRRGAATSR